MNRVLVTGANGFVGSFLCKQLRKKDLVVRAAVRSLAHSGLPGGFDCVEVGDIDRGTDWYEALANVDCVVHLAARVHVMKDTAPDPLVAFRRVNRDGTLCLAEQAAQFGARRFIYISTIKVNGEETFHGRRFTADDAPAPVGPYGISKLEAERGLVKISQETGMEIVIIRPPLVYGHGVKGNFQKMIHWLNIGIPLPLGSINNQRSFVGIDNLVDFIITCIDHPAAANQIFLVADGEDLSTTELLKRLAKAMGKAARLIPVPEKILFRIAALLGKREIAQRLCGSLQVDISKAREILDWHPPVSVDEGLKHCVEALR